MVYRALDALALAYTLTGDACYARKALLLLDRIADVYPEMDTYDYIMKTKFEHSDGGSGYGRIEGRIWETGVGTRFALSYDRVFDGLAADPGLVTFLRGQAEQYGLGDKSSTAAIQRNIEENLLMEIVKGVRDVRIRGNQGMHQLTMAAAAIALDRQPLTNELLDWVFQPGSVKHGLTPGRGLNSGGNIQLVICHEMDRDGMGSEGAPGYCCWGLTMLPIAELLDGYPAYTSHNIFQDFPKYKQCFITPLRWTCLGQATPPIGDSGSCGSWSKVGQGMSSLITAFKVYRDPRLARAMVDLAGGRLEAIPPDIYAENPLELREAVVRMTAGAAPQLECQNLNGFGLAVMQTPDASDGRALWMYYGRNTGHGHRDRLQIGLYAENVDMLPDLGYPEYASSRPADLIWERNSIAHNVVIVDDRPQASSYTGHLLLFDGKGKARVLEAESPGIFPSATTYRRLTALVDVSANSGYAVDFFRVRGGSLHRQSWHGPASEATSPELRLVRQARGTFAGEEVAFGQLPEEWRDSPGYMFLYDVQRDSRPPAAFTLDYRAQDRRDRILPGREPHLRLTCLTGCDEVCLAHGDPPQNKSGNPRNLAYAVLTRRGKELESLFTTIVEPYDTRPIIASVRPIPIVSGPKDQMVGAVEVTLVDGRVDTIVSCERPARVELEGGIVFKGTFGIVARRGERIEFAKLVAGTQLAARGLELTCDRAFLTGKVVAIDADRPDDNRVTVSLDGPADTALTGAVAIFENDRVQDAAYTLCGVTKVGGNTVISTGDSTLVRGYADPKDFAAGYTYNVSPGDAVRIPMSVYTE